MDEGIDNLINLLLAYVGRVVQGKVHSEAEEKDMLERAEELEKMLDTNKYK